MSKSRLSRREFLWLSMTAGVGLTVAPRGRLGLARGPAGANDRVMVGVVGLGLRGRRHVAEYLKLTNVAVAAVCDVDETRLRMVSEELSRAGLPRPFLTTDYRRLLELGGVDMLSVATPKQRRVEIGLAACEAGKHVMMEKPFSASIKEGRRLVECATSTKRFVQQRESHAFAPPAEVSTLTRSVGEIRAVRGWKRVSLSASAPELGAQGVRYDELVEFALDELDVARCLLEAESPAGVTATSFGCENGGRTRPAAVALQFDFADGTTKKRSLNFELKFASGRESFKSKSVYLTSRGEVSVECSSDFEDFHPGSSIWENLVSCVRANDPDGLQNPISEAHKSCSLIHLAAESLQSE